MGRHPIDKLNNPESLRRLLNSNPGEDPLFQQHCHQLLTLVNERLACGDLGNETDVIITYLRRALDVTTDDLLPQVLHHLGACLCLSFDVDGEDVVVSAQHAWSRARNSLFSL
jgi:hypothetical protein